MHAVAVPAAFSERTKRAVVIERCEVLGFCSRVANIRELRKLKREGRRAGPAVPPTVVLWNSSQVLWKLLTP